MEFDRGESSDEENDNLSLSTIVGDKNKKKHIYKWKKCGVQQTDSNFVEAFSPPPIEQKTPLEYFTMFFPESLLQVIVDNTNLYSAQKSTKNINTNVNEIKTYIGMRIVMGIINYHPTTITGQVH